MILNAEKIVMLIQGRVRYICGTFVARANGKMASNTSCVECTIEVLIGKLLNVGGKCIISPRTEVGVYDFDFESVPGTKSIVFEDRKP